MVEFESLFRESHGKPISYHGETLLLMDRVPVPKRCRLSVVLLSTGSEWPQAIRLKTKGSLTSRITGVEAPKMVLWAKDMREPHSYDCLSQSGELLVWNAWAEPGCALEAWVRAPPCGRKRSRRTISATAATMDTSMTTSLTSSLT